MSDYNPELIYNPKETFEKLLKASLEANKDRRSIKFKDEYDLFVLEILDAQLQSKKTDRQKYLIGAYSILTFEEIKRVICKKKETQDKPPYFVYFEEIYEKIDEEHKSIGHGGRDRTFKACQVYYENITVEAISMYLTTCLRCQETKRKNTISNIVIKPIRSKDFLSRTQIDLIDCQAYADGKFKWILTIQDHFTKFIILRALMHKCAVEVAWQVLDYFLTFGASAILQSDNGKEFVNSIINELKNLWPELKIVHGRPRHPQSQGSVERANGEVKKLLGVWIRETKCTKWAQGIKFVQFQYNKSHNRGTKNNPFKTLFGIDAPIGLKATNIPSSKWNEINSDDDLNKILEISPGKLVN